MSKDHNPTRPWTLLRRVGGLFSSLKNITHFLKESPQYKIATGIFSLALNTSMHKAWMQWNNPHRLIQPPAPNQRVLPMIWLKNQRPPPLILVTTLMMLLRLYETNWLPSLDVLFLCFFLFFFVFCLLCFWEDKRARLSRRPGPAGLALLGLAQSLSNQRVLPSIPLKKRFPQQTPFGGSAETPHAQKMHWLMRRGSFQQKLHHFGQRGSTCSHPSSGWPPGSEAPPVSSRTW